MPDVVLPVNPATLPSGFCATTWQQILNEFSANQSVTLPAMFVNFIASTTKPGPEFQGNTAWQQLDSLGRPGRIYFFAQGAWLSLHGINSGLTQWYFGPMDGTLIQTFDGGDNLTLGPYTGPIWQFATNDGLPLSTASPPTNFVIAAQFPIAAGTLPSTKVLNVGDKGGEENHSSTVEETAPHTHTTQTVLHDYTEGTDDPIAWGNKDPDAGEPGTDYVITSDSTGGVGVPPVVTPHNNMPPYVVGYLLQRTSRAYYRVDA